MRKTVVDGSATSGFQRTALVALGGYVDTSFGRVGIQTVCIEEESSGIVNAAIKGAGAEGNGNAAGATYRLDRLGIPLVEIATDPDIKSGAQAKEAAFKIGTMLRSTGKVQRGIGTIRQDLNVSVSGGNRVEVKGAQELDVLDRLVDNEAKRQSAVAALAKKAPKKVDASDVVDVTALFAKASAPFIKKAISPGGTATANSPNAVGAYAISLSGFAGLLGTELLENRRFGTELSAYAKAAAGVGGIIHSDEDLQAKYGISNDTAAQIAKATECKKGDAWVAVVADKRKAMAALAAVHSRASVAHEGVVKETRRAVGEKTEYMRPLPGSARMYPETDVPPVAIASKMLQEVEIPKTFEEKTADYQKKPFGLSAEMAARIAKDYSEQFETYAQISGIDANFIATTLAETITAVRRKGADTSKLSQAALSEFFECYAQKKFTKSAAVPIIEGVCTGKGVDETLASGLARLSKKQVAELVAKKKAEKPGIAANALFGEIIRDYRLVVDPADLSAAVEGK